MTFAVEVQEFVTKLNQDLDFIYSQAITAMVEIATREQLSVRFTGGSYEIGKVPVLTRELAESLFIQVNGTITGTGPESVVSALQNVQFGDFVEFGWMAPHAQYMEYGTSKIEGRFFATNATNQWDLIVRDIASVMGGV